MKLVVGLEDADLEPIADILRRLYDVEGLADYYPYPEPADLRRWYMDHPDWDPLESAKVVTERGVMAGYGFAYSPDDYENGFARVIVDPLLPPSIAREAAVALLRWAGSVLRLYDYSSEPVWLGIGKRLGYTWRLVWPLLSRWSQEETSGYLMVYDSRLEAPPVPGVIESVYVNMPPEAVIEEARDVVNDAFSAYPDHYEWTSENAYHYYATMYRMRRGEFFLLVAREYGEAVGIAEGRIYRSGTGRLIGYVSLLAVRRGFQGRGLGKRFLSVLSRIFRGMGAETMVLDSVPEARRVYESLGFSVVYEFSRVKTVTTSLERLG